MEIRNLENLYIDWEKIPNQKLIGTTGYVLSKKIEIQNLNIRQLIFSRDYEADHWCEKGHIIYVISGELIIEFSDGSRTIIPRENSLILGDSISSHKAKTEMETKILIID